MSGDKPSAPKPTSWRGQAVQLAAIVATAEVTVPPEKLFVLGDNRGFSPQCIERGA